MCPVVGGQKTLVSRLDRGNVFVSQLKVIEYTTSSGGTSSTGVAGSSAKSSYHTVLQFPYDPAKAVYELDGTYGAILAMKQVRSRGGGCRARGRVLALAWSAEQGEPYTQCCQEGDAHVPTSTSATPRSRTHP